MKTLLQTLNRIDEMIGQYKQSSEEYCLKNDFKRMAAAGYASGALVALQQYILEESSKSYTSPAEGKE